MNTSTMARFSPGQLSGRVTLLNSLSRPAPSISAASSSRPSCRRIALSRTMSVVGRNDRVWAMMMPSGP